MKLISHINRRFLVMSILLLLVCSVMLFFSVRYVINSDVDDNLRDEHNQIVNAYLHGGQLPDAHNLKSDRVEVKKVSVADDTSSKLIDTLIYYSVEDESIPHRQLAFVLSNGSEYYRIAISQSELESEDLLITLLIFGLIFITALLTAVYFINHHISRSIWIPFNDTLEKLKSFDISDHNRISFSQAEIIEFDELNKSLNLMTEKIYDDFNSMKRFTENASHEIQTPLSIIRSKIETLIQTENISEEQMNSIQQINEAVSRLAKLNTSLITLTKIENNQFTETGEIQLNSLIREKVVLLEEIIQEKKITVSMDVQEVVLVHMNASLADLLFDNLLANAVKHNTQGGLIKISVNKNQFSISNSGAELQTAPEKLFDRFVKNNPSSDSLGLGLAMVKQICGSYHFKINFTSEKNIHTISISF